MNDENQNPVNPDGTFDITKKPETEQDLNPVNIGNGDPNLQETVQPPVPQQFSTNEPREIPLESLNANQPEATYDNSTDDSPELNNEQPLEQNEAINTAPIEELPPTIPLTSEPEDTTPAESFSSIQQMPEAETPPQTETALNQPVTPEPSPETYNPEPPTPEQPIAATTNENQPTLPPTSNKTKIVLIIGIIVVLLGGAAFAFYSFTGEDNTEPTTEDSPPGFTLNLGDDVEEEVVTDIETPVTTEITEEVTSTTEEETDSKNPPSLNFNSEEDSSTEEETTPTNSNKITR